MLLVQRSSTDRGFDAERVTTVTFDSYSTLVDVDAAEKALADRVDEPEPVSKLWRSRSLAYTFVSNAIDAYQPFYEMNRDALQHALDAHGADLATEERDEILAVYHELDVFDDVRNGIEQLRDSGYPCCPILYSSLSAASNASNSASNPNSKPQ